jgi:pimeloyl-ACP methyl ester carboxylesterase
MDAAGRGASDWLSHKQDYSFGLYLTDAAALLARVTAPMPASGLRKVLGGTRILKRHVDWVGTSMGGLIGMMLAAKRNSPIRRLVLNDVGPLVPWAALLKMKQAHTRGNHGAFSSLDDVEAYLRQACGEFGPLTNTQWRHVAIHGSIRKSTGQYVLSFDPAIITHMRSGSVSGVEFGNELLFGVDLWPTYDAIRCPTLVIRGAESDLLLQKTAIEMTKRGPRAQIVEFAGIGHAPWLMADDQVSVIREFLLRPDADMAGLGAEEKQRMLAPV